MIVRNHEPTPKVESPLINSNDPSEQYGAQSTSNYNTKY